MAAPTIQMLKSNSTSSSTVLWRSTAQGSKEKETLSRFCEAKVSQIGAVKQSRVCSRHFEADDFVRTLNLPGLEETIFPRLKRDEIGITPYPTIQSLVKPQETISARASRAIQHKVSEAV